MDTFMDKLAQKFTAQEMIKANAAAEAAELQRTRDQVKKYNDCLQEMKQVNDNTKEALAQIEKALRMLMQKMFRRYWKIVLRQPEVRSLNLYIKKM